MPGWGLFWVGVLTIAFSVWYARPQTPLGPGASWWARSGRSYGRWKGSWAPFTIPLGALLTLVGLVIGLSH